MKRTLLATFITTLSLGAIADDAYYVTFGAAHTDTEVTKDYFDDYMKHSYDLELSAGYLFDEDTAIELSIVQPSPEQVDGRADVEQARLSGLYFFGYSALKPYISAGVGYGKISTDGGDVENALLSLGYGVQVAVTDNFFARAEVRYDDMINEVVEHNNYVLEAGYRFGAQTTASDYSSANNMTDEVEEKAQAKADEAKAAADKAAADAEAKAKAAAAAKLDSDKDGVIDTADKCTGTPANTSVDTDGCPEFKGSLQGVFFETSSARLTESSKTVLDNAATELKRYPNLSVEVQAFTDSRGSDALNQKISQERANSVRTYLLNKGVSADKITAKGYGEANPVASNETVEGRAANRRVELSVKK